MTIVAKFAGRCTACGEAIAPGQRIEWSKGQGSRHESCDGQAAPAAAEAPSFAPTAEQTTALDLFRTGRSLAIEAGAGTGKTSTLRLLAGAGGQRRGQYVAFNRAIVEEGKARFPHTVACNTAHSLAMRAVGQQYRHRLQSPRMRSIDLALRLGVGPIKCGEKLLGAGFLAGAVMAGIVRFCQTADLEPSWRHIPYIEGIDDILEGGTRSYANNDAVRRELQPAVTRAWADLMSPTGVLPFRHDHYLKAWHLAGPRIGADYILFDEAQDANPVMVAIVAAQEHAQLVWVGDSQQQIYSFTGAINALAGVPAEQRAFLTQSFRFGPEIAAVANRVLGMLDAELRITGAGEGGEVGSIADPSAILTRTNAAAVHTVLRYQSQGRQAALVGGGVEVVRFAKAADELQMLGQTEHPDLACFGSWGEVQQYVDEDQQGVELRLMVKLVDEFGTPTILDALDRTVREADADVVVSTAHKAKGREWPAVQLAGDFPEDQPSDEELRLIYVACTRARRLLDIDQVKALDERGPQGPQEEAR